MKCEQCQSVLEEYFDGEMATRRAAEVRAHLTGCAACAAALAELRQEHALYARYERDVEVTPDLWAGIEARIKTERAATPVSSPSRWRAWMTGLFAAPHISPAFAALLVVLAIGLTAAVMSYLHSRGANNGGSGTVATNQQNNDKGDGSASPAPPSGGNGQGGGLAKNPDHQSKPNDEKATVKESKPAPQKQLVAAARKPQAPPDPMKLVREAEQKYLAAIAILSQDVTRRRSQIDPAVLARFDSALADIDRTIAETRQIVRRNPDDPVALQYLLGAYAKKVDTLRAMTLD